MTLRVLVTKGAAIASAVTLLATACDDTDADASSNSASTVGATMVAAPPASENAAAMGGMGTGAVPSAAATPSGAGMPPAAGQGGGTGTPPGHPLIRTRNPA